ncbi:RelE toxin of RelE / RelB toxin-antitoxin system [Dyadobacter soli]|uniref:RelE toxin of RelE / RelB toxin-antitoxin system n=1 Tax=Dyadobacter soli TaxID=659014 RepID=A0A1G7B6I7_9BACT|nr:type II toxin-antitoxin system RelE/ParE family toxin [Dyadobacter soli]SDE22470.1 RelE toxin of RelE / RelB toxin-antitoxin system [Dyadobacter soli]
MSFEVETLPNFEKEAKRLKKKFSSLANELLDLIEQLESNPFIGTALPKGFYKIRLSIKSKGKGKRGGARVITHVKVVQNKVFLISIYDKSEQSDISDDELNQLLSEIPQK